MESEAGIMVLPFRFLFINTFLIDRSSNQRWQVSLDAIVATKMKKETKEKKKKKKKGEKEQSAQVGGVSG
jgi:hypothetical protein